MMVNGRHLAPSAFSARKGPQTRCTGGWVGPRNCLGECGEKKVSFHYQGSKHKLSSPWLVAIDCAHTVPRNAIEMSELSC